MVALSKSRMAPYVRSLGVGPPSNDQGPIKFSEKVTNKDTQDKIRTRMLSYAEDNQHMRCLGDDFVMIRTAFQNMQNITKLAFLEDSNAANDGLCEHHDHDRLRNIYPKWRGPDPTPCGWNHKHVKVCSKLAWFHPIKLDANQSMARIFLIGLEAADRAGLKIESIDSGMGQNPGTRRGATVANGFNKMSLHFPLQKISGSQTPTATFSHLSVLRICVGTPDLVDNGSRVALVCRLKQFLSHCPSLETFGVTICDGRLGVDFFKDLASSGSLKKVQAIEFANIVCHYAEAISILQHIVHISALKITASCIFKPLRLVKWISKSMTSLRNFFLDNGMTIDMVLDEFEEHYDWDDEFESDMRVHCTGQDTIKDIEKFIEEINVYRDTSSDSE